jgi:hypothetical protein
MILTVQDVLNKREYQGGMLARRFFNTTQAEQARRA